MKKVYSYIFLMIIVFCIISFSSKSVKAGTISEINGTNKFDITNDGNKDNITIETYTPYGDENISEFYIYVNGKKCYAGKSITALQIKANYLYVNKNESYINVYGRWNNGTCTFSYLLKYKSGKLKKVNEFSYGLYDDKVVKISSKKMTVESKTQCTVTGYITYHIKYKKKKGKWVKTSSKYKVKSCFSGEGNKKFKSTKKVKLYKKSSCKGKSYSISKGKKFKLLKVKIKKNGNLKNYYGYFKCGKKKGWINLDSYDNYGIFDNILLAG